MVDLKKEQQRRAMEAELIRSAWKEAQYYEGTIREQLWIIVGMIHARANQDLAAHVIEYCDTCAEDSSISLPDLLEWLGLD